MSRAIISSPKLWKCLIQLFFDYCNFSSAKLWKWEHIHFLDALASLDLKLSVSQWVIYRFQLAHLRVFQSYFTPFPFNEGFDSSNFYNFTFSSPQVWEYENVTCNVFYLAKLIIPKRKRRILFCNHHYFDQQKSVSHLLKIVYFYPPAK